MIPEIGHFALMIALSLAVVQALLPLWGAYRQIPELMALARPAAYTQMGFILVAFISLTDAFIRHDFSVSYVAMNSNSALPLAYRISAVWGAHEGSLLLWILILGGWTVAVARYSHHLPAVFSARVLAVMGGISVGFMSFVLFTSNPFSRLTPIPVDGQDLNPLLQDPGLIFHPPLLYMGYVGFAVAFSFAIAALLGGQLDNTWARWSRPWTLVAWLFLTLGIALGSWWAYYELGWGGWWFWDPVENASFMPWLVGTALIHSLIVTEKRSAFKRWTVLLAMLAFSLSLLGTFLVRSGVLTSVHAFAADPKRGIFILSFLGVVIGGSLALYAWRAPQVRSSGQFMLFSRETALLAGNVLLVVSAFSVLLGTLYPLFADALQLGKLSVGPPYFNTVFLPLMVPVVVLMGLGPFLRWKAHQPAQLLKTVAGLLLACLFIGLGVVVYQGQWHAWHLGIVLSSWIILTQLFYLKQRLSSSNMAQQSLWRRLGGLPRSLTGMIVAHIGLAITLIGITLSSAFSVEKNMRMVVGDTYALAGYQFQFKKIESVAGPNYTADEGHFEVWQDSHAVPVAYLKPQKRLYSVRAMPMAEAGIDGSLWRDLYVALDEPLENNQAWAVRLYYKPFIRWIWAGALVIALGALLAATDRRYRLEKN